MVTTNVAWVTDVTNDNSSGLPGLGVTGKSPLPQPVSQCDVHCGGRGSQCGIRAATSNSTSLCEHGRGCGIGNRENEKGEMPVSV